MIKLNNITVFCGTGIGNNGLYREQALLLGTTLARQGTGIIYGGARVGLMGAVADGALMAGGKVTGVFPAFLDDLEISHRELSELIIVDSMHERKTRMYEMCDGIIALPGGFGTLEELFEILTWAQLGLHKKPMALLNIAGYYDGLAELISKMVNSRFLLERHKSMLLIEYNIDSMLHKMKNYKAPETVQWISEDKV